MRAVDRQQSLRGRDRCIRFQIFLQHRLGDAASTVAQAFALGIAAMCRSSDRSRPDPPAGRHPAAPATPVAPRLPASPPRRRSTRRPGRKVRWSRVIIRMSVSAGDSASSKPVDFLPQRRPRLLLRPAAPELFGESAAQHRSWRGHSDTRQQRSGLAAGRQHALAANGPGFHLADQPQPHDDMVKCVGRVGRTVPRPDRWYRLSIISPSGPTRKVAKRKQAIMPALCNTSDLLSSTSHGHAGRAATVGLGGRCGP